MVSVRHTGQGPAPATPAPGPIGPPMDPLGPGGPCLRDTGEDDVMGDATATEATTAPTIAILTRMFRVREA